MVYSQWSFFVCTGADKFLALFHFAQIKIKMVVVAKHAAILKRTLPAIVVRLLRRLKKPSRNDDPGYERLGLQLFIQMLGDPLDRVINGITQYG